MASKGGLGIDLDLDRVPVRETGMTAYEIMLSESQERMLMVLKPGREAEAEAIFRKWELDFAVVGQTTDTGRMVVRHQRQTVVDVPIDPLAKASPEYDRPWQETPVAVPLDLASVPVPTDPIVALVRLLGSPDLSSKRWIWEQYDHMVMGDTVQRPGGDAAVIRVHGTQKGLAVTCDVTPRYVAADPEMGTKQAVVETWRNLTSVGADPIAITDNMNFANPERPEVMGQFVASIRGMGEACRVLDYPVVSGNVSLYNETNGVGIPPTPAIGAVGLVPDIARMADIRLRREGDLLIAIGREQGWLGQSLYQQIIAGKLEGAPPPVDLADEIKAGRLVRSLIREGKAGAVHDISDGGLLVAICEMALAGGIESAGMGVELFPYEGKLPAHAIWFGEDQGRYVLAVEPRIAEEVVERARLLALPARIVGRTGGDAILLKGEPALSLADLRRIHERWLPQYMGG
jgi:phosphoribosylformylglycinamidine synthase